MTLLGAAAVLFTYLFIATVVAWVVGQAFRLGGWRSDLGLLVEEDDDDDE